MLFSNLNILHINNYPSKINAYHKIFDALNYVNTKYSVLCADDDFIISNGIKESIDFLEKNEDFSCAQGHYISFYLGNNLQKKEFIFISSYTYYNSITSDNAKDRFTLIGLTYGIAWITLDIIGNHSILLLSSTYISASIVFLTGSYFMIGEELRGTLFNYLRTLKRKIMEVM